MMPASTQLWGLNNTGQTVNGVAGTPDADIDAVEAWNIGKGLPSNVIVAVIDTGVARTHPDLAANMFTNPGESGGGKETNGIDDDGNGRIDDFQGFDFVNNDNDPNDDNEHGTHVAGTIAAKSNNSVGVAGVASFPPTSGTNWKGPKILAIKVLNASGSGSFSAIADGFAYAGVMGAKVANASLGAFGTTSATLDAAIAGAPNTLFVIAAGNNANNNDTIPVTPCVPASTPDQPNKICVAATDSKDVRADFSNFGVENVDLAAPGVSILSSVTTRTFFQDNFESALAGRWTTNDAGQSGPAWGLSNLFSISPTRSITDSPGGTAGSPTPYSPNQNNWARNTNGLNLTGGTDCSVSAIGKVQTEQFIDLFRIETTLTPANEASWSSIFTFSGAGQGSIAASLPAGISGQNGVFVRLRLTSNATNEADGAYIDDFKVKCSSGVFDATSFEFLNGTSMATPHVAGAAAFLFTRFPGATVAQIKARILRGVDKKENLGGEVATGGRLNLYKAAAESRAAVSGGVLTFTAGPGQTNNVRVARIVEGGVPKFRISDPYSTSPTAIQSGSRIIAGPGCAAVPGLDFQVKCPAAGITRIVLNGGDLNDLLDATTIQIPLTLNGGPGNDRLIGGTKGDILNGGLGLDSFTANAGNDTINAKDNQKDTLFKCGENAGDSDKVNADSTPNDPIAANPGNCEVVNKS